MDTKLIKNNFVIDTEKIIKALDIAESMQGELIISPVTGKMSAMVGTGGKCHRIEIDSYLTKSSLPLFSTSLPPMVGSNGFKDKFGHGDGQSRPATKINRNRVSAQEFGLSVIEFMKLAGYSYGKTKQFSTGEVRQWSMGATTVYQSARGNILEVVTNGEAQMETNFWKDWEPTI